MQDRRPEPNSVHRVTSLPADDKTPGWYHLSPKRQARPALKGDAKAPFVVIGAGFTGLAAARQLALNFPDKQIILVEAQEVGFGTSGRNAGFAIDLPHDISTPDYIGELGKARKILAMNRQGQSILHDLVQEHGIECHLRQSGKYQAALEEHGLSVLEAYRGGLEKLGQECTMVEGDELPEHIGTKFYKRALYTPGTMLLQPAMLVKGLADTLPANVTLFEHTPITSVTYGPQTILHHPNGQITAEKLILANDAFGTHFGFLPRSLLPIFTYGSITRPLTLAEQKDLGGKDFWGVIPGHPFGTTVRRTHDNRIFVRNSFSFIPDGRAKDEYLHKFRENHKRSFDRRFPMLPDVGFEYTWGGGLAMSRNGAGFFGQLLPNVYGALGSNGLGITRGTVTGTLLADWLAGKDGELIQFLLNGPKPAINPPEPFLSMGVNFTLWREQSGAGLEA
ncbi:NAD(P)/FAD-dependent oxidoreductase [Pseudomonas putida]|uniref:NAD(P)/FAD-dependent oxidoreductase n=1 Tax=Pseudomonas putida TaxID=303 RepID=UPI003F3F392F